MKKLLLCIVATLFLAGCGSDTNGTLTLADITVTDLTGGRFSVGSSAVVISSSGKAIAHTKISYTATFKGTLTVQSTGDLYSDSNGSVIIGPWPVTQDTVPVVITITVTSGDLSATKTASVPAATP